MTYAHGDMNLEIRHLRLVAAVADEGGLTAAANRLHLTQSALSHQLREAEERLGTRLFERLQKRMTPTVAGERLLRSARAVLAELAQAEEEIHKTAGGREGVLRLASECYTNYHWLPGRLRLFHRRFPRVEVQVAVEATKSPFQSLLDGKLDLAIVSSPVRDRRLHFQPLFEAEMVAVMPPSHPLAARPFLRPEDFTNETVMVYTTFEDSSTLRSLLAPAGVVPKHVLTVQLTEAMVEMVKAGMGISVLARWAVAPQLASGGLVARPLTRRGVYREWSAVTLRQRQAPPYLIEFIRLLAEEPSLRGGRFRLATS